MNLKGNTIIITGGSSGIGFELAKVLTGMGNQVIICGRSWEKLEQARQFIPSVRIFQCDVAKSDERKEFLAWVEKNHPQCNMLINNAAIVHQTDFFSDPEIVGKAELEIQTNFIAPLALTKLFYPLLKCNQNPKIIYITTGLVYVPRAIYPIYCATKSALHSFVKTLRLQIKNEAMDIYEVLMPAVDTPFHRGNAPEIAISAEKAVEEMCHKFKKGHEEIKVGGVKVLYPLSRIAPSFAFKKVNSL